VNSAETLKDLQRILEETKSVFQRVRETEEKLQDHLVKGEALEIQELEPVRLELQQEAERLKEERESLLPEGYTTRSLIGEHAYNEDRETFLSLLDGIDDLVYQVKAHQEVNRSLLQERLRFVREMREVLLPGEKTYDTSGQVSYRGENKNFNLDQSC